MSFPRYLKYKDSGVEWLGEVPEHWGVQRLKRICRVFPSNVDKKAVEGETPVLLCNYTDVYYNDRIVAGMDFMPATATDDQIAKFTLRAGDTIITKDSETADDIAVAALVPNDLPGVVCGYHLSMVRPQDGVHGAFVKRLFDSAYAKSCFAVRANGLTRVGLSQYELDNVDMPVPPPAEQTAIAAFLDRETSKIDALIAEQQRLIELLQEKRQAAISHAVAKGVNPNALMKDSGIEWLGEVPEHWEEFPLGTLLRLKHGFAFDGARFSDTGEYILMTPGNFQERGGFRPKDPEKYYEGRDFPSEFILTGGQLLVAMTEQAPGLLGSALFVPDQAVYLHNQRLGLVQGLREDRLDVRFLYHVFNSPRYRAEVSTTASGSKVRHTSPGKLLAVRVFLPPLAEQRQIVVAIGEAFATIDQLCGEAESAIALLQERRSALISAAVTGQIDVRGLVGSEAA
jgi:type I restriction enzyme S subunit